MNTLFATSPDGTRVAYDRSGAGPAIVLLHGGGGRRQDWDNAGYIRRLQDNFTVILLDLRGHGESGLPTEPADYTIDKMVQDILAVADACEVESFTLWGMSYGGKVGRYLAAGLPSAAGCSSATQSARVANIILMGTPLGPGVTGQLRQDAIDFCAHWPPIMQAQREGRLDVASLSPDDQDVLRRLNVAVMLGWVRAMLDWPAVEPADFRCPTLWLMGSEDRHAMDSFREYEGSLAGSQVQVHIVEGLDHMQVFEQVDRVFPTMLAFTQARKPQGA
jgi:pimeloyl-ACP methyl ester carboxylesterase